jgi:hypothetical protein
VATDNCDPAPVTRIISVTSSEPVTGSGDKTTPDWQITGNLTLELRAEVTSKMSPRVYTIKVCCTDASGNTSCRNVLVKVPKNKNTANDSAADATAKSNSGKKK